MKFAMLAAAITLASLLASQATAAQQIDSLAIVRFNCTEQTTVVPARSRLSSQVLWAAPATTV